MVLYKDDWEKELIANQNARDAHKKGFEILTESCKFFQQKMEEATERPKE